MRHNNQVPNIHFKKDWKNHIKTWFNQPARKQRRKAKRVALALKVAPRPVGLLRPIVRCPEARWNRRLRLGRGFTLDELKEVGVNKREARTIGISVDYRRRCGDADAFERNVNRLKAYKAKLVIFPKKGWKHRKKGDCTKEQWEKATQVNLIKTFPNKKIEPVITFRPITAAEREYDAHLELRKAWREQKFWGTNMKRTHFWEEAKKMVGKKGAKKGKKKKKKK